MRPSPLTIVKVGGGLLGSAADLEAVVDALVARRRNGERLVVVVSALGGVTDRLDRAGQEALDPRSGGELVRAVVEELERRHRDLAGGAVPERSVGLPLRAALDGVQRLLTGIRLTGELTDRAHALLLAHGEMLSAPLVAAVLRARGADARAVSSEEAGLRAVGSHRVGSCELGPTREGLGRLSHEIHDRVLVVTGFYGRDEAGDVVLFGRGGTDYTAGVVAACLAADGLELWKDVPGFLTADPRLVPGARMVAELSFEEACELGYYGARILHPRCLEPVRGLDVAIRVCPVGGAPGAGTAIRERPGTGRARVAALAHRPGVAVVRVGGAAMVNEPGVGANVLAALGRARVNVTAVASSMTALSAAIDDDDVPVAQRALRLLQREGAVGVEHLTVRRDLALIGLVGDGIASDVSAAARLLGCLGGRGLDVALVSHGPGDVGVSCAVPAERVAEALEALHEAFFADRVPSS